jgi:hypothetical protein
MEARKNSIAAIQCREDKFIAHQITVALQTISDSGTWADYVATVNPHALIAFKVMDDDHVIFFLTSAKSRAIAQRFQKAFYSVPEILHFAQRELEIAECCERWVM